jgi:anti-anti-sigma factor
MSDLAVSIDLAARIPVVTVVGDVDHHTWPTLAVMLANVVHAGNEKAIVDLSGVDFMDSGALKAFAASGACELIFRDASPLSQRILDLDAELGATGPTPQPRPRTAPLP